MAWILVPASTKSEPVEDGEVVARLCGACGRDASFSEHRGRRGQKLMECGECGARFRTGDVPDALDTAVDSALPVLERAKEALSAAGQGIGQTFEKIKESFSSDDDDEPTISDDDPIKADLLRRFEELEKRTKKE